VIRKGVEVVLQALIESEATEVIGADRYERAEGRSNWRNGNRDRLLATKAGDVGLKIPKLRFSPSRRGTVLAVQVGAALVFGPGSGESLSRQAGEIVDVEGVDSDGAADVGGQAAAVGAERERVRAGAPVADSGRDQPALFERLRVPEPDRPVARLDGEPVALG
jgi:hypothetical protein